MAKLTLHPHFPDWVVSYLELSQLRVTGPAKQHYDGFWTVPFGSICGWS